MPLIRSHPEPPPWLLELPERLPPWTDEHPAGPWNLCGMLRAWQDHPLSMDFLDPQSPNHHWLGLQTELYEELLCNLWEELPSRARVLDAACGIGRFLLPLARAGHKVLGMDACLPSLRAAERHLLQAAGPCEDTTDCQGRVSLIHCDLDSAATALEAEGPFDLVLAMELLSYVDDFEGAARRLATLLRPGGHFVASVEAWPGGLIADPGGLDEQALAQAQESRILEVPGDRWVRLVDAPEFASILRSVGLTVRWIQGSHFLPDGPLGSELDLDQVGDPAYNRKVVAWEARLRDNPGSDAQPRALVAVAQRSR